MFENVHGDVEILFQCHHNIFARSQAYHFRVTGTAQRDTRQLDVGVCNRTRGGAPCCLDDGSDTTKRPNPQSLRYVEPAASKIIAFKGATGLPVSFNFIVPNYIVHHNVINK